MIWHNDYYCLGVTSNKAKCTKRLPGTLRWRHNDRDGVPNYQRLDCLLNRLFRRRSKKTSKLRVTGLCEGNSPVAGEFTTQRASNAVSIWFRHHEAMVMRHVEICGLTFSCHKYTYKFKPACYLREGLRLHDNLDRHQCYFPIERHLLNTRLGNIIFGICIQPSPVNTVCLAISSQILTVDNLIDPPIPDSETLSIFVLSEFNLYSTSAIMCCMQHRVILSGIITRLGYIMQHSDCLCTLRPRQNGRHFADAMLKWTFLNKEVWLFNWNFNELCCRESNW